MTPAIKLLQKNKIDFKIHKYEHDPLNTDFGQEVVDKLNLKAQEVFKTLVVEISNKKFAVAVVPVDKQLSLKAMANALNEKKVSMAKKDEAQKITGYLLGGVSPFGQKKILPTILDESSKFFDTIYVSGGKRGLDIEINSESIIKILNAKYYKISQ